MGHVNIKYNSIVAIRGSTGAGNEAVFTQDVANNVCSELRKRGFEVKQTDANGNDDPQVTQVDWDLFLAIHFDADVYGRGGGFSDFPEPSTDMATTESQRICAVIQNTYFPFTNVEWHQERRNANTKYYYIWKCLTDKTPCVLIECGVGMHKPDDFELLQNNRGKVVEGVVRSICAAFGVAYDLTPPTTQPTVDPEVETVKKVKGIIYGKGWSWQKINAIKALLPQ